MGYDFFSLLSFFFRNSLSLWTNLPLDFKSLVELSSRGRVFFFFFLWFWFVKRCIIQIFCPIARRDTVTYRVIGLDFSFLIEQCKFDLNKLRVQFFFSGSRMNEPASVNNALLVAFSESITRIMRHPTSSFVSSREINIYSATVTKDLSLRTRSVSTWTYLMNQLKPWIYLSVFYQKCKRELRE